MKRIVLVEIEALAFPNTPILQYSKTARHLYRHTVETLAFTEGKTLIAACK